MSKQTLFGLGLEYQGLKELAQDEFDQETGELIDNSEELNALWEELSEETEDKVDGYIYVIKELLGDADALDKEVKRLNAKKTALKNGAERLRTRLFEFVNLCDDKKFSTKLHKLNIRTSKSVEVKSIDNIPREYLRLKKEADKTAIKKALQDGIKIPDCSIVEKQTLGVK